MNPSFGVFGDADRGYWGTKNTLPFIYEAEGVIAELAIRNVWSKAQIQAGIQAGEEDKKKQETTLMYAAGIGILGIGLLVALKN